MSKVEQPTSDPAALEQLPAPDQEPDLLDPTCATTTVPASPDPLSAGSIPTDDTADTGPTDGTGTDQDS